jgi:ketosteroid isomerase-like protein
MKNILMSVIFSGVFLLSFGEVFADDAADVRATIERHYAAIHAGDPDTVWDHHLKDFTMFSPDGGVLFESDRKAVSERMGASLDFPTLNVAMASFDAQIYGNVAVATFFLVGSQTRGDHTRDITNRVSAVWVKVEGEWKEAHHHESQLLPGRHKK